MINDIAGNIYDVTGAAVSDLAALEVLHYGPTSIAIDDTLANVHADLTGGSSLLLLDNSSISSITENGDLVTNYTANQALADEAVLEKIAGIIALHVTGALVDQVSAVGAMNINETFLTVSDSAASVQADLASGSPALLLPNGANFILQSITLTDVSATTITLTEARATAVGVATVLSDIGNLDTLQVTGVTLAEISTVLALDQAMNAPTTQLAISDTTALIEADLTSLSPTLVANASHITGVAVNNGGTLTLTVAQMVTDLTILAALPGYQVVDTAANIEADLALGAGSAILTHLSQITAVTVSSGGPLTLTVAEAETTGVAGATGVVNDITGHSYDVTGAAVSDLSTLEGLNHKPTAIAISDNAAHIDTDLGLGGASQILNGSANITSITVSNTTLTLTAAEVGAVVSHGLGSDITGTVHVTGTASTLTANIDALQTLDTAGELGTVSMSNHPAALSVTAAQFANDNTVIGTVITADSNAHPVLYIQGTNGADTVDASSFAYVTDISLDSNTATMSFVSGVGTTTNAPDTVTLGSAASTVEYTVGSGVEVINGFQLGTDLLNMAMGSDVNNFTATDITMLNGVSTTAIALTGSNASEGVILVNPGVSAAMLLNNDVSIAGSHVLIS